MLRFIGPLPATAWLPMAFFTFPSSWSASTFLIALATGFPVTVLTWSGVASVSNAYYDVARTLGATPSFLVLKVAIPAALPHVFVGLFMGLGSSFARGRSRPNLPRAPRSMIATPAFRTRISASWRKRACWR